MKAIRDIAKAELKTLFYSPVAWLILIIFTFQCGITFTGVFSDHVRSFINHGYVYKATMQSFGSTRGLFTMVQQYLYLYIPLLTMGVFSRELSSGSIKLLYSSPVRSRDIIYGKYLALLTFCLTLLAILSVFVLIGVYAITEVDFGLIFCGLLGLFLLMATYTAIGLFMSSLTSYTVVSAMGTMAVFALLTYVRNIGQETEWIRDVTYWLSIAGRSDTFIAGMITTEDLLYFILISITFLTLTYVYIGSERRQMPKIQLFGRYALIIASTCTIGFLSSLPSLKKYADLTADKKNTLKEGSQEVVRQLRQPLTITTYVNILTDDHSFFLPRSHKHDIKRFDQYMRFKPDIKLKYVYYYAEPEQSDLYDKYKELGLEGARDTVIQLNGYNFPVLSVAETGVDLASEHYRTVRCLTTPNGHQTFLRFFDDMMRYPSESEISAAMKRMALETLPTVGFIIGHNERNPDARDDRGYRRFAQEKSFRYALVNQGFDFAQVSLDQDIPSHIQILLFAEPRKHLMPKEVDRLKSYINQGGNMIIAGEPGQQDYLNPVLDLLGLQIEPGVLVQPQEQFAPDLMIMSPTDSADGFNYHIQTIKRQDFMLPLSGAAPMQVLTQTAFAVDTLFQTDAEKSWNELQTTNYIDEEVAYNPELGELKKAFPTVLALHREQNGRQQRIFVTSDADWLSNQELRSSREDIKSASFILLQSAFYWLTNEELPIDLRGIPYKDRKLRLGRTVWTPLKFTIQWGLPTLLIIGSSLFLLKRKGK